MKTNKYEPWKPPFSYNQTGQWIQDSNGSRILDMRGWGWLTGMGSGGLAMEHAQAANLQDSIGLRVAELMNADQLNPEFMEQHIAKMSQGLKP